MAVLAMAARKNRKRRRVGLSRLAERNLKAKLRETAPSEPWIEAQIHSCDDTDEKGKPIVYRFHQPRAFPAADMAVCCLCGRHTPMITMESPVRSRTGNRRLRRGAETPMPRCADCRPAKIQEAYGGSPSARSIAEIQNRNLRMDEVKLESEDVEDLEKEIRAYYRGEGPSPFIFGAEK